MKEASRWVSGGLFLFLLGFIAYDPRWWRLAILVNEIEERKCVSLLFLAQLP